MDKTIKQLWIKALRSGKYQQGQTILRSLDNKFCCLGVLCDILESNNWKRNHFYYAIRDNSATLPDDTQDRCKIDRYSTGTLMQLNDREKADFNQIADWIETNL